jgi:nicotinate-nucleotide pyrophosphorylase (carboxylating)
MTERPLDLAPLDGFAVAEAVANALAEDRAAFDVTTAATVPPEQLGSGEFVAREPGVICGLDLAREALAQRSEELDFIAERLDGEFVEAGTTIATVDGPMAALLSAERIALNFLQRLSGVATLTREYVARAAEGGPARVVDTRKTTPGLRTLERYAVRAGGGANHRNTLEDGVLIKDNHIAAAAQRGLGIAELIEETRARAPHTLRIEIEADTAEQAHEAAAAGADIVMLDNMSGDEMRAIVEAAADGIVFEASGGITLDTIREAAASGVHVISVGALTHSAPALDIALDISVDIRPLARSPEEA